MRNFWESRWHMVGYCLVLVGFVVGCAKTQLPTHTVASDTSLSAKNTRRIEIHVDAPDITREDTEASIIADRKKARPHVQVPVRESEKTGDLDWIHGAGLVSVLQMLASLAAAFVSVMLYCVTKKYASSTEEISRIALEQVSAAKQAALLPILADMFQEYRSPEFKESLVYIHENVRTRDSTHGFANVPHMMAVSDFFDQMGVILQGRFVDEEVRDLVFEFMASSIIHSWELLAPVVDGERALRDEPSCQHNFETLAERAREWKTRRDHLLIVE